MVTPLLLLLGGCPAPDTGNPGPAWTPHGDDDTGNFVYDTGDSVDTGPDPATLDQDGDGYTPNDGDCDDERAHVHPGAPDYCDGLDADCDGEPIPDGSCSELGDPAAMWSWSIESTPEARGAVAANLGDATGDGRGDLAAMVVTDGPENTTVQVLPTENIGSWPARNVWPDRGWGDYLPRWVYSGVQAGGDTNGDGLADLWLSTTSASGYTGAVFLVLGKGGGFDDNLVRIDEAADAEWLPGGDIALTENRSMGGTGDVSGDGLDDAVFLTGDGSGEYQWRLIPGSLTPGGVHTFDELAGVYLDWTALGISRGSLVGDLNGDGLSDGALMAFGEDDLWRVAYIDGSDWVDGAHLADMASVAWGTATDHGAGLLLPEHGAPGDPGDIDGDGLSDGLLESYSAAAGYCTFVLSGGIPEGDVQSVTTVSICPNEGLNNAFPHLWIDDVDDDESRDLIVSYGTIAPSSMLRGGGAFFGDDLPGPGSVYPQNYVVAVADLTGDGRPELVYGEADWKNDDGEEMFRHLIVAGFEIPWDDPTKW